MMPDSHTLIDDNTTATAKKFQNMLNMGINNNDIVDISGLRVNIPEIIPTNEVIAVIIVITILELFKFPGSINKSRNGFVSIKPPK